MNLIYNSRIYYRRLTTWTRAYLLARYFGIGTAEELFGRLYFESLEIGDMMKIFFGREYTEQYSQLLSRFAILLRDIIDAQLEGNTEAVNQNVALLYENVAERAVLLEEMNPYWNVSEYVNLFNIYIQYILETANAMAAGDFRRDMELYDLLAAHTNIMGDVFAQGIADYITSGADVIMPPGGIPCITYEQMNQIYDIRMFWFELVTWIRNYMTSRYLGIGAADEVFERLKQVPLNYVTTLQQLLGGDFAEEYLNLLNDYLELISAFITAQMENNIDEINRITQLLYQNADERAELGVRINPFLEAEYGRPRLYNNIRSTIDESTTFLTGDYARNIDIFARLLDLAENVSTFFAQSAFNYIVHYQQGGQ